MVEMKTNLGDGLMLLQAVGDYLRYLKESALAHLKSSINDIKLYATTYTVQISVFNGVSSLTQVYCGPNTLEPACKTLNEKCRGALRHDF